MVKSAVSPAGKRFVGTMIIIELYKIEFVPEQEGWRMSLSREENVSGGWD